MRVDIIIIDTARGKFAMVSMEMDLSHLIVGYLWFHNRWFNVEYEGLHSINLQMLQSIWSCDT